MNKIIQFINEECKRQHDFSPASVEEMLAAWNYAQDKLFTIDTIEEMGRLVKPQRGFRRVAVVFANGSNGAPYTEIKRLLNLLLEAHQEGLLTPDEFYYEFEKIHPFADGNGRVGAILWNILMGNIENPICPPEMFS